MRHRVSLDWSALCCGDGGNRTPITVRCRAPQVQQLRRVPEGPEGQAAAAVGDGRAWLGYSQRPVPTGVEGAGGTGGPGCGGRGRWQGLAGLRDDAPSEARGADGERAGRRPRAHKAARPDSTPRSARNTRGTTSNNSRKAAAHGRTKQPGPTRHTTRSRPAPSGPGGTRVRRQLSEAADQPTLQVAPSRPSATVTPAAARRSRSSSARAQSLAARAAARSSRTA